MVYFEFCPHVSSKPQIIPPLVDSRLTKSVSRKKHAGQKQMISAIAYLSSMFRLIYIYLALMDARNWWCLQLGAGAFEPENFATKTVHFHLRGRNKLGSSSYACKVHASESGEDSEVGLPCGPDDTYVLVSKL